MEMRLNHLSVKLSFLLLTPMLANAQLAPGEDPAGVFKSKSRR